MNRHLNRVDRGLLVRDRFVAQSASEVFDEGAEARDRALNRHYLSLPALVMSTVCRPVLTVERFLR